MLRPELSPNSQGRPTRNGRAVPNSPLNRIGYYSPSITGVKKPFNLTRPRRHSGSHAPDLPNISVASGASAGSANSLLSGPSTGPSSHGSLNASNPLPIPSSNVSLSASPSSALGRRILLNDAAARLATRTAQRQNDALIYLEGTGHILYSCTHCRTHLTSHEDILSKSFHGRHGRAFLFDSCVNVTLGPEEDRMLITGLHTVCDLHCKRCNHLVGWTYQRAYEASQKYKEGKFIIEKIHLYMEHEDDVGTSPGVSMRGKKMRSHSWGNARDSTMDDSSSCLVYEYDPRERSLSSGG